MTLRQALKFSTLLPDGRELKGAVELAPVNIGPGARPSPESVAAGIAKSMRPVIAACILPHLPDAAPSRKEIGRDAEGRITSLAETPAIPPPTLVAAEIAAEVAREMGREYQAAVSAKYAELDRAKAAKP